MADLICRRCGDHVPYIRLFDGDLSMCDECLMDSLIDEREDAKRALGDAWKPGMGIGDGIRRMKEER